MRSVIEIPVGKFSFHCYTAGDPSAPLVLLLHGFPESAYMWTALMQTLSTQGFYCIAPDLRGYSPNARPVGKHAYQLEYLTQDVLDIAQTTGKKQFHLIGHDWGAVIGWKVTHDHPDKILSWTALSIPHYQAFGEAVVNDPVQQRMSKYMKSFQWPWLPEFGIRRNDFALFRSLWASCSQDTLENYLSVFRSSGALTAALNYYRANYKTLRSAAREQILGDVSVPTLFIWGENDLAVGRAGVENGHRFMKGYYKFIPLQAGHWLIQSNLPEISTAILEHVSKFR